MFNLGVSDDNLSTLLGLSQCFWCFEFFESIAQQTLRLRPPKDCVWKMFRWIVFSVLDSIVIHSPVCCSFGPIFSPGVSAMRYPKMKVCENGRQEWEAWMVFRMVYLGYRNSQATLIMSYLTLLQSVAAFDRLGLEVWFHSWDTLIFPANISPIGWPAATLVSATCSGTDQ